MSIAAPIQMASLGMADSLILMVMALVVFGPRRLPQIGRQIGRLMYEFRKASNDFKYQMERELQISEEAERAKTAAATAATADKPVAVPEGTAGVKDAYSASDVLNYPRLSEPVQPVVHEAATSAGRAWHLDEKLAELGMEPTAPFEAATLPATVPETPVAAEPVKVDEVKAEETHG